MTFLKCWKKTKKLTTWILCPLKVTLKIKGKKNKDDFRKTEAERMHFHRPVLQETVKGMLAS
jgi:hypothetical protein